MGMCSTSGFGQVSSYWTNPPEDEIKYIKSEKKTENSLTGENN
jgi:hypothetical protein